jgi:hypothetical protein
MESGAHDDVCAVQAHEEPLKISRVVLAVSVNLNEALVSLALGI